MRRTIVVGGFGFFGRALCEQLSARKLSPLVGSRRAAADIVIDVEEETSIHRALRADDLVIDAVGPFQKRTTLLVECAMQIGFDVIDLADSLAYVERVYSLRQRIDAAGVRVLTACSMVSAVSAAAVSLSGITAPKRVTGILVPATRHTAVDSTAASLFSSVGQRIQVFEDRSLVERTGWQVSRKFRLPPPIGLRKGYLFEAADSYTLPIIWPSLETTQFFVDTNVRGLNVLFTMASRHRFIRMFLDQFRPVGLKLSRILGRMASGVGYIIEGPDGQLVEVTMTAREKGYLTAVTPAVLAADSIYRGEMQQYGLITPERQVNHEELINYLQHQGIICSIRRD